MEQLLLQVHVANFWIQVVGASLDHFFVRLKEQPKNGGCFFSGGQSEEEAADIYIYIYIHNIYRGGFFLH